ncbi:retrovirus-related pol polyprotein from transposon TNT 1-94 [Tanacetum coccineum]
MECRVESLMRNGVLLEQLEEDMRKTTDTFMCLVDSLIATLKVKIEAQRAHSIKIEKITRFPTHTPTVTPETLKPTMVHRVSMISKIEPTNYRTPHQYLNSNLKMPILHSFEENKLEYEDEYAVEIKMMGTGMDKESLEHNLYKNDITPIICHNFSLTSNPPIKPKDPGNYRMKDFQDNPDDEEDTRSCQEYLNDLEEEFHERAMLAKSKRFFKKGSQRFSDAKATDETQYHKCRRIVLVLQHLSQQWSRTKVLLLKHMNGMKKMCHLMTMKWLNLMALADDENVNVGKESARNGEWVKISMRKTEILKENQNLKKELKELTATTETSLNSSNKSSVEDTKVSILVVERPWLSEAKGFTLPNHDTGRILPAESQLKVTNSLVIFTDSSITNYDSSDESLVYSTLLPLLERLASAEPGNKNVSASKKNSAPTGKQKNLKTDDDIPFYDHDTKGHNSCISLRRGIKPRNPQHVTKSCETCGSNVHTTTDHNDIEWFKRGEVLQAKKAKSSNANRSKALTERSVFSKQYWAEAVATACYTQNRCPVFIHNHKDHLGKFDEKADDGYFLRYSLVSKAFRVFNTKRQQTKETYHITFDESCEAIKFSKPSVDDVNIAESERYPPDEYLYPFELSQRWSKDKHIELVKIVGNPRAGMLTRAMAKELSAALAYECLFVDFLSEEEPKKISEALKHTRWVDAMQEELNQFARNKV